MEGVFSYMMYWPVGKRRPFPAPAATWRQWWKFQRPSEDKLPWWTSGENEDSNHNGPLRPSQEAAFTAKIHWAPHVSWDPAPVDGESEPAKCELQAHGQSNCLYSDRHLAGRLPVSSEKLGGLAPQHDPAVQLELNIFWHKRCLYILHLLWCHCSQSVFTGPKFQGSRIVYKYCA